MASEIDLATDAVQEQPDPPGPGEVKLFWDFFGPRAEGTARHFRSHLEEFLERESVDGCSVGISSGNPRHWATWCLAPVAVDDLLTRALKPRRRELG
jgi:hypothetical protein